LGLSQDPGLIAIGKVKPFNFVTQPKLHHSGDTTGTEPNNLFRQDLPDFQDDYFLKYGEQPSS